MSTLVGEQHNGVGDVALDCSTDKFEVPVTTGVEVSGMEGSLLCNNLNHFWKTNVDRFCR